MKTAILSSVNQWLDLTVSTVLIIIIGVLIAQIVISDRNTFVRNAVPL